MVTVSLVINQAGKPDGEAGVSRDDLSLGTTVVLSNDNNSGVTSWLWTLVARPGGSGAVLSSTTAPAVEFIPDLAGSYLVELKVNGRVKGRIIAAVKTSRGWRIPAAGEADEFDGWWAAMEYMLKDANDNIGGGGGGGGQTNTVTGEGGILNIGNNVNAVLTPTYGSSAGTICQGNDARLSNARTPTGAASGQLGDTYPGPDVRGLRETGGPTLLTMGSVSDGQVLTRSGSTIIGSSGGGGGNTLDGAYDEGGAGAGRAITVDSGPVAANASGGPAFDMDGYLTLHEISTPSALVFRGNIYSKRVSGDAEQTELFYLDNNSNEVQITDNGVVNGGGGGGVLDRDLVFSDDTEFTETGTSYVTKKTFRIIRDSLKYPSSWHLVLTLWTVGGTSAECQLQGVGSGTDQASVSSTATSEGSAAIKKIDITITGNEPVDTLLTINIQLKQTGGGTAHLKYTDLYAVYT